MENPNYQADPYFQSPPSEVEIREEARQLTRYNRMPYGSNLEYARRYLNHRAAMSTQAQLDQAEQDEVKFTRHCQSL